MSSISNFPYFEVQFNKQGGVHDQGEVNKLLEFLKQETITDLFIISHGWNNDMDEARRLYRNFFEHMREVLDSGKVPNVNARKFAVLAVLWPSKKFAEQDLIASGAASLESPITNADINEQLDILKELVNDPHADGVLEQVKILVPQLEDSPSARAQFADLVRSVLQREEEELNEEDASTDFFELDGEDIMNRLSKTVMLIEQGSTDGDEGGAAVIDDLTSESEGGAVGLEESFSKFKSAAHNLINFATYYQMKERAGTVGREGVNSLLRKIRTQNPDIKLHLIGHSFGGRLVTAAAMGPDNQSPVKVNTVTLLQAAFSHYGFAENFEGNEDGFFRRLITTKGVSGPILISYTKNDTAVGIAYPLASLISQDDSSGLGDENDRFGGIGRNGAQKTPEANKDLLLMPVGSTYQFQLGRLHNLRADDFIKEHGDICKNEVAYAVFTAVAMT
jgi:hypothetical protein